MKWTKEQSDAINLDNNNIIVSAGAGSGKTAVLTERVLRKIKDGVHIDELLILTFTNAAAKEMKLRIRKALIKNGYEKEASIIDSAYITTFDSYSLSLVKKYNYLLNIDKSINITSDIIISIEENKVLDEIFDTYYDSDYSKFNSFIKDFCYKDDNELKKLLLKLYKKIQLRIDKEDYLKNYIEINYADKKIEHDIYDYFNLIKEKIDYIELLFKDLSNYVDIDFINKLENILNPLFNISSYDDVSMLDINISKVRLPNNSLEEAKVIKAKISEALKDIKKLCIYENSEEIKKEILSTKSNIEMIIELISLFDKKITKIKHDNSLYSFNDISSLAIKLVKEQSDVREYLKNKFNEIMVDEYQDTNDIQEYFISLISKDNVYMVGDIKQSIYRFRNANPYIFKNKYDLYDKSQNGIKIDLVKNFRSRKEVLKDINLLFDYLMSDEIGGANYKKEHEMNFGLDNYNKESTDQNYELEVLTYDEEVNYSNSEKEAFIIADDIINKTNSNYMVYDKDTNKLRKVKYSDFVILIDRSSDFELYKKILEYKSIPVSLFKDEEIKNDYDILVIKSIMKIIISIDKEDEGNEFKYAFLSLGRSFLFNCNDKELFEIFNKNSFKDTLIYKKCLELYNYYYDESFKVFFLKLLEIFNYEENLLKLNNIYIGRNRIEYFYNLISDFESDGKGVEEFILFLDEVFKSDNKASFSLNNENTNSVKIMTIHKSKGLEFPVCYFSSFKKEFSYRELNDLILYDNKIGIVVPYFNKYYKDTIYKNMLKTSVRKEEISEKIRLLYVALTRAREKMIIVIPKIDNDKLVNKTSYDKLKFKSFLDMITYIYYEIEKYISIRTATCTKDYLYKIKDKELDNLYIDDELVINDLDIEKEEIKNTKFSKVSNNLITLEDKEKLEFGTKIHELLEYIDFKNPNYDNIDSFYINKIKSFINSDLIRKNLNFKFYKEYEFIYEEAKEKKHGIIDLMIENDDEIIIVDYKLKNIDDSEYDRQLLGYKSSIEKLTNKKISLYLYSIIDEKYRIVTA